MAFTGAVVRLGTSDGYGVSETNAKGCDGDGTNLFITGGQRRLIKITDLANATGEFASVIIGPTGSVPQSLAWHDGSFYCSVNASGDFFLYRVDPPFTATTATTYIGEPGQPINSLLSDGTTLYGIRGSSFEFYSINITTGALTELGTVSGVSALQGSFIFEDTIYALSNGDDALFELDDSYAGTQVGSFTLFNVSENNPRGGGALGEERYMVGRTRLYRFLQSDTTAALSFGSETIDDQAWTIGTAASLTLPEATGGTGTITYSLSPTTPAGVTFTAGTRLLAGTPTGLFTLATFTYTATDEDSNTETLTFTIVVTAAGFAFDFGSETIDAQAWRVGTAESLTLPEATGGTGAITYSLSPTLPTGVTFTAGTRLLAGTPTGRFTLATFTYTATDADSNTVTLTFTIVVTATAITFDSGINNQSWTVGTAVSVTTPTLSGGVGAITYSVTPALPAGVTFTAATRLLSGIPTAVAASATYTYTGTDTEGVAASRTFSIVVSAAPLALGFGSETIDDQAWDTGDTVSLTLPQATGGTGTITYSLSPTLPAGLTFDATARTITGTTTAVFTSAEFTYTATDGNADTVTLTFDAVVAASALTFSTTIADQAWDTGDTVSLTLPAATGVGTITYRLSPTLPAGLTFDATARTITGTTTAVFTSAEFTYTATDTNSTTATLTFDAVVAASALTFSQTIADQSFTIGDTVALTLPAATGVGTITYTLTPTTLPGGLTFNATARTVTGTTTAVFTNAEFTYTAKDGNSTTAVLTFDMAVAAPVLEFSQTIADQSLDVGDIVDLTLPAATGGTGTITYSLSPTLPAGLTFDATARTIAGTTTAAFTNAEFTYTATDGDSTTVTLTFDMAVSVPLPIGLDGTIAAQNWIVGTEIDIQLPTASGGTGTLTYEIAPALPDGMTFDEDTQQLTGTPRAAVRGVEYRYSVEDGVGTRLTLYFRLYVRPTAYTASNQELVSMLPPNSTEWERAVEETLRENILPVDDNDHIQMPTIDAWNPDLIPEHLTPYLGLNLSIEVDAALPETEQRNLLRASYGIHSIEGTPQALLDVIHALGYAGAVINEGVEDPADNTTHWAHYSIFINQSITVTDAQRMIDLVKDLAPARCKLVSVDIAAGTESYDGTIDYDGTHTYGQISEVSGLVL